MKYLFCLTAATALLAATPAQAEDVYVSLSGALINQSDSDNEGAFTRDFLTGAGTTIAAGTPLPNGTSVGWTTDFKPGYMINGAVGKDLGAFRVESELSFTKANVDTHTGVEAGGIDLTNEDAAVLIQEQNTNLGITVGDLAADGQGSLETSSVFINGYFDFETDSALTPYVGAGIGYTEGKVDYSPSDVAIIDDKEHFVSWQLMAGLTYQVSSGNEFFGGVRYRSSSDLEVDSVLAPFTFDVENKSTSAEVGYRVKF